ncbi:hypothetical protein AMECASPLE_023920 [Ameca splendens]|uniref:Uncharacterized protein n=1 Tax=Ameca splendens TaxID=208324 RepID=A0ABV0Y459_9TELE
MYLYRQPIRFSSSMQVIVFLNLSPIPLVSLKKFKMTVFQRPDSAVKQCSKRPFLCISTILQKSLSVFAISGSLQCECLSEKGLKVRFLLRFSLFILAMIKQYEM